MRDKMPYTEELKVKYEKLFATVEPNNYAKAHIGQYIEKMVLFKDRFALVQNELGIPWYVVGVICGMESFFDMTKGLHCGQRWDRVTTLVPKGKGPFASWADAAIDALESKMDWLFPKIKQFDIGGVCYFLERYNGPGYFLRGRNSDYLWGNSNHDDPGRFVADGRFDPDAQGKQIGAMVILKYMQMQGQIEIPCAKGEMQGCESQKEQADQDQIDQTCYSFSRQLKKLVPALNHSQEFSVAIKEIREIAIFAADSCGEKLEQ